MKKYRLLACFLAIIVTVHCMSFFSIALSENGVMSGAGDFTYEGEPKDILTRIAEIQNSDDYTSAQKVLLTEKLRKKIELASSQTRANYSYTLNVPYQRQETSYYCGPATVRQTLLTYGVANVPSQSQIAIAIGATTGGANGYNMMNYINANLPNNAPYAAERLIDLIDMEDMRMSFVTACRYYGPPILLIDTRQTPEWQYSTDGHFLNVSGVHGVGSNYHYVTLTDPYIGWVDIDNETGTYTVSLALVYQVLENHSTGGIYWW